MTRSRIATLVLAAVGAIALAASVGAPPADREEAARLNNRGVADLEQFKFGEANATFRQAIALDPAFLPPRINLAVARLYEPDLPGAREAAERASRVAPEAPQPQYLLGLIARAENRPADAEVAFERVLAVDAADAGTNYMLAQVYLQQARIDEALVRLDAAMSAEPYNASVVYSYAQALARAGRRDESARWLDRFSTLRESASATSFGQNYLEQGRYAEAVDTTGAEPGLVDVRVPDVTFVASAAVPPDSTASRPLLAVGGRIASGALSPQALASVRASLAIADFDQNGYPDVASVRRGRLRILRNRAGHLDADTTPDGFDAPTALAVVAGDVDNDGLADLVVTRSDGVSVLRNAGDFRFVDVSSAAGMPAAVPAAVTEALVDVDHDGDLDVFLAGIVRPGATSEPDRLRGFPGGFDPAGNLLLRNNGNGTFTDTTAAAGLAGPGWTIGIVPTDFDNRRDVDVLLGDASGPVKLFRNMRDGTFRDVAEETGLRPIRAVRSVAAADVNKDGYTDFFFGASPESTFALSNGRGRFTISPAPGVAAEASAALFVDYDLDGLLDLVMATPNGLQLLRNIGSAWQEVGGRAFPDRTLAEDLATAAIGAVDLDLDGDQDLVVAADAGLRVLTNSGGNRHRSVAVSLRGRVTNRQAVGVKVDLRAGSLQQKIETSAASPAVAPADVVFGLGGRPTADALRVIWVSGILQAEGVPTGGAAQQDVVSIEELNRKPSSCPFLYSWNGERFQFITDFLGGGETGAWLAPGLMSEPDPEEYVRIPPGQLVERHGVYDLRITNELEEVLYLDRVALLAVAHPAGTEVYPDEGLTVPPKPHRLLAVADVRPVPQATDDDGRNVAAALAAVDRTYVDGFPVLPLRGYAAEHAIVLDLSGLPDGHSTLLLTGWTDYAFSSDNVAASQAGLVQVPPAVQVQAPDGTWQTVVQDIGFPVGRPQTIVVEMAGRWLSASRLVRVPTTMRVYWDRAAVGRPAGDAAFEAAPADLTRSDLRWRGYSAEVTPDGREPMGYDYARVSWRAPWKLFTGRYTGEGDVSTLLEDADDRFVVSRPGDEIALQFSAARLPSLPAGWERTFLLRADGFSKEMDINSAGPHEVLPLPYHGMRSYPYEPAAVPARTRRALADTRALTTRHVAREVTTGTLRR